MTESTGPSTALRGLHLHLTVQIPDRPPADAVVHLERTGHLGVSTPYWIPAQAVAQAAIPVLQAALATLTARAADDREWAPPRPEELE